MATLIMKGQHAKLYHTSATTTQEIGECQDISVKVNNNAAAAYQCGSRVPVAVMEGLQDIRGTAKKILINATDFADRTETSAHQTALDMVMVVDDGTTTVTCTLSNCIFNTYNLQTTPGELVVEDVEFIGTAIAVA